MWQTWIFTMEKSWFLDKSNPLMSTDSNGTRLQSSCSNRVMQQDIHQFRQNMTYSNKFLLPLTYVNMLKWTNESFPGNVAKHLFIYFFFFKST